MSKTAIHASWRAIPNRASTPCSKPKAPSAKNSGTDAEWRHLRLENGQLYLNPGCGQPLVWARPSCLLTSGPASPILNPQSPADLDSLAHWLESAALTLGFEAQPAETPYADFERHLPTHGPRAHPHPTESARHFSRFFPAQRCSRPISTKVRVDPAVIRSALCADIEAPILREIQETLDRAQIPPAKQARARDAILRERLSAKRIRGIWLLRLPPGANFRQQLRHAHIPRRLVALGGAHAIQYLLWILAWYVVGSNVLRGGTDRSWLIPWALLLLTLVPLRVLIT